MNLLKIASISLFLIITLIFGLKTASAATDNTIDSTNRYAYGENAGWIDFGIAEGNVHVTDSELNGYGYGENIGWISLNCSNTSSCGTVDYKVSNSSGVLSGYAYGENAGWIDFHPSAGGVTIDSTGNFHGQAYGENIGWITFNCADTSSCGTVDYKVSTTTQPPSSGSGGGGSSAGGHSGGTSFTPSAPPPNTGPQGCQAGDLFNRSTGASCSEQISKPIGCNKSWQAFSPTTGESCSSIQQTPQNQTPFNFKFTRGLIVGAIGEDVRQLQIFLNTHGFTVTIRGRGSRGNEVTYFGTFTRDALARYQAANGIKPAGGYFGPITRTFINSLK